MTERLPTPGYSITLRLETIKKAGVFGAIASAISAEGGDIKAVDTISANKGFIVRDLTVNARDAAHERQIVEAVKKLEGVRVLHVTDRTFLLHHGGKIEIHNKVPIRDRNDLSMLYTPGVARVARAIAEDRAKAYRFTIKRNSILIATDGTAVLGLGDIGPYAAMPVMEGKAMLFKEFAGIDAFPIALLTKDPDEIVRTIKNISPPFGGVNLEDISAPRCFEIEERLRQALDIPVVHDDQHCTAIVILAALINSLKLLGKDMANLKIAIAGAGAAGMATAKLLLKAGIKNMIVSDRAGIIYRGRKDNMNPYKEWLSQNTNPGIERGGISEAMKGADVFIGVSVPNIITTGDIKLMSAEPVLFTLANPEPEIAPEEAMPHVRILATGRSDYPNQINNMLAFPGLFRGLLDSRAKLINDAVKVEAAKAIAEAVDEDALSEDNIMPSIFDYDVTKRVGERVIDAISKSSK